jgi:tyrosinase
MLTRKNVKNLTSTEKEKFVNAVLKLKKAKSIIHHDDPKFNRYDDYVEIHMHAMMVESPTDPLTDPDWHPGWAHNGPSFFPWHREYLLQFEKDLQSVSEDETVFIPYWDWSDSESNPFTSDFLGSDGESSAPDGRPGKVMDGPFAFDGPNHWTINVKDEDTDPDYLTRGLGRRRDAPRLPTLVQIDRIMKITFYDSPIWKLASPGFRTAVEVPLHNLVHRWVNGTMLMMGSPNDPVFWLHHANVDRLWGDWQRIHPTTCPYLPSKGATQGHNLYDVIIFSDDMHHHTGFKKTRVVNVLNHILLGYQYDSDPIDMIESFTREIKIRDKISREKHRLQMFPSLQEIT